MRGSGGIGGKGGIGGGGSKLIAAPGRGRAVPGTGCFAPKVATPVCTKAVATPAFQSPAEEAVCTKDGGPVGKTNGGACCVIVPVWVSPKWGDGVGRSGIGGGTG